MDVIALGCDMLCFRELTVTRVQGERCCRNVALRRNPGIALLRCIYLKLRPTVPGWCIYKTAQHDAGVQQHRNGGVQQRTLVERNNLNFWLC